ncbi:enoyl-CoA hydratase-related protein, partial [Ralstonia pseudosolanacearum]|uniref:enoyl-CoA hydratase-related protein n=1 Tax=Ralstonia pseudosolanacearum TaxID=1310165 RepID=UPI003CF1EF43
MIALDWLHDGTVALLTLSRPPANAFTPEGLRQLQATVETLDADPRVRALVITGDGPKFFSAGAEMLGEIASELAYGEGLQAHARSA